MLGRRAFPSVPASRGCAGMSALRGRLLLFALSASCLLHRRCLEYDGSSALCKMVFSLSEQLAFLVLLVVNHIASFVVTASVVIWFETVFPNHRNAPSLWAIVLPLRAAIFYTLHSAMSRWTTKRMSQSTKSCQLCRTKADTGPLFSVAVTAVFQALFYEPRWVCAVLGVDEGPMCSLPHAIILEIPMGFTMLAISHVIRSGRAVGSFHLHCVSPLTQS